MPINIGKIRFVDFIKESTTVSVKSTFETSIIEMPTMLIIVAQDAKFGECTAFLTERPGSNSDQNNYICRLFQNVHPILKFNFNQRIFSISDSTNWAPGGGSTSI